MHEKFPQWYAAVAIQADPEKLGLRASAIDAYLEDLDAASVEPLIRLAFAIKRPSADSAVASFRHAFSTVDASFPDQDNDRELQILAAVTLACLMEGGDRSAAFAAIAVTTTSFLRARTTNLPMDLPGLAEAAIRRIAAANGARPRLGKIPPPVFQKLDFATSAAHAMKSTEEGWKEAFQTIGNLFRKDIIALRDHQTKVLTSVEKFIRVQDEELQMLWWVVGGRSEIADAQFGSIPAESRPIVLAEELSGLVEQLPGPSSIRSLLSRGGIVNSKKVTVTTALKAAYKSLNFDGSGAISPVTQPIHFGLSRLAEVDGADGWETNWGAVIGIPSDIKLGPLDLAELYFREALLNRFADE